MRIAVLALAALVMFGPGRVTAQQDQTLADIRQELTVLYVEVQRLKRELSTTGAPGSSVTGTSVLDRVSAMETALQKLTAQTEQMGFRIERIVTDGTNRIGDLEFRLVELEGGDVSQLGETTTLGGDIPAGAASGEAGDGPGVTLTDELAVGEQADYQNASKALEDGDYSKAAEMFSQFEQSYPGSPLAPEANLGRGKALDGLNDTREAARAYLASFTANPTGPVASDALFELGAALGRLGQKDQACVTLGEVGVRFPTADAANSASQEMATLGCT
jgi:tol-pal system protein YbgF